MTAGPATADEAADSVPETPQESSAAPTPADGGGDNVAPPGVDQPTDVPSDEPAVSSDAPVDETIGGDTRRTGSEQRRACRRDDRSDG
ncbi:MAG: hypothetical protein M5U31_09835 [Acidimicrobiia bacterium]|nr:hypothetical protein [Acidimicrobiia bacterium]